MVQDAPPDTVTCAVILICLTIPQDHPHKPGEPPTPHPDSFVQVLYFEKLDYLAELSITSMEKRTRPSLVGDLIEPNTNAKLAGFVVEGSLLRKSFSKCQ